jgi:hypothetical protein
MMLPYVVVFRSMTTGHIEPVLVEAGGRRDALELAARELEQRLELAGDPAAYELLGVRNTE